MQEREWERWRGRREKGEEGEGEGDSHLSLRQ